MMGRENAPRSAREKSGNTLLIIRSRVCVCALELGAVLALLARLPRPQAASGPEEATLNEGVGGQRSCTTRRSAIA